jgi:hypothetical protein
MNLTVYLGSFKTSTHILPRALMAIEFEGPDFDLEYYSYSYVKFNLKGHKSMLNCTLSTLLLVKRDEDIIFLKPSL